jgi:hypothetical protein
MPLIGKAGQPSLLPNDANEPRRHLTLAKTPTRLRNIIRISSDFVKTGTRRHVTAG